MMTRGIAAVLWLVGCGEPAMDADAGRGLDASMSRGEDAGAVLRADGSPPPITDGGRRVPPVDADLGHAEGDTVLSFADVTRSAGLDEPLDCMMGHAAAVGDVDSDGFPDLLVGTFSDRPADTYLCAGGARPDRLLRNAGDGTFTYAPEAAVEQFGRSSGAVFADLDNDGDLDLVVTRNANGSGDARRTATTMLYRNDGGTFVDVTDGSGVAVSAMKARNVIPLDYDGDGLLDLFVVEDLLGSIGSKLLHNESGLRFVDRTAVAGLPTDLGGLGAAAADVNGDGWPDIFVAHEDRLFVNDGAGRFEHASHLDRVFRWPGDAGSEDWRCGAAFGDVNRDGRLDLVVSHHYGSAYEAPRSVRLYLNRSGGSGVSFVDATGDAGLPAIPAKAPHVEIQDMDNDGWPDILVSVHAMQGGAMGPLVHRNEGDGTFSTPSFTVPYDRESNLGYWPAAPTLDYDRDGRLDFFGAEWFPSRGSVLYRNTSRSGNYLEVAVRPDSSVNAMGIGARVEVYESGSLGEGSARIATVEIGTGYGYSSGQEAIAHVGLADRDVVDVRVVLPHGGETRELRGVTKNQRIVVH
jgi:hypothetical protein